MNKKIIGLLFVIGLLIVTLGCGSTSTQSTSSKPKEISLTIVKEKTYTQDYYLTNSKNRWEADDGQCFLVIYVKVENVSCSKEVSTHPGGFEITLDNIVYGSTTYMGPNKLRTDRLLQGGKTEGYVVFEIPEKYKGKEFTYHIVYEPVLSGYGCGVEYIVN